MRRRVAGAAAFVALALAVVAAWAYSNQQQQRQEARTLQVSITALVQETNQALRSALAAGTTGVSIGTLEHKAAAARSRIEGLRELREARLIELTGAVDGYLVSAREIMRTRLAMERARERVPRGVQSLTQHVSTSPAASGWMDEAVRLKQMVDADFRDYRITVEAYLAALKTFPAAQAAVAAHVQPGLLIDTAAIEHAKQHALDTFSTVNNETRLATDLDAFKTQQAAARQKSRSGQLKQTSATRAKGGKHAKRGKSGSGNRSGKRNR
jgi:hypothetical protein